MMLTFTPALALALLGLTPPVDAPVTSDCCCKAAEARTWVVIDDDRVAISPRKPSDAELEHMPKGTLVVACREFRSEAVAGNGDAGIRLHCQDAHFLTTRGFSGRAAYLAYDSASGMLELKGAQGGDVGLAWESASADEMSLVATKMLINLKSSRFELSNPAARDQPVAAVPPAAACQCAVACPAGGCCTAKQVTETCPAHSTPAPSFQSQADQISNHARPGLYILESEDGGTAAIWHHHQPGAHMSPADGQRIELVPGENQFRVLRAIGLLPRFKAPCSYPDSRAQSSDDDGETADDAASNVLQFDVFRALR